MFQRPEKVLDENRETYIEKIFEINLASILKSDPHFLQYFINDHRRKFILFVLNSLLRDSEGPKKSKWVLPNIQQRNINSSIDSNIEHVKPLPSVDKGLHIFEFFSGIGGMRVSLPSSVNGICIKTITAFDVSPVANQVYEFNFESSENQRHEASKSRKRPRTASEVTSSIDSSTSCIKSELRKTLIESVSIAEVDGIADIWTMSPPCQVEMKILRE